MRACARLLREKARPVSRRSAENPRRLSQLPAVTLAGGADARLGGLSPPHVGGVMKPLFICFVVVVLALLFAGAGAATAAPEGTLTWGVHVTLAARWLDPSDTEAFITPFMVLYALHDALVKPMP